MGASCEVHKYLHHLGERGSDEFVEHEMGQGLACHPAIRLMVCAWLCRVWALKNCWAVADRQQVQQVGELPKILLNKSPGTGMLQTWRFLPAHKMQRE